MAVSRVEVAQTELQVQQSRETVGIGESVVSEANANWTMVTIFLSCRRRGWSWKNWSRAASPALDLLGTRMRIDLIRQSLALRTRTRYTPTGVHSEASLQRAGRMGSVWRRAVLDLETAQSLTRVGRDRKNNVAISPGAAPTLER